MNENRRGIFSALWAQPENPVRPIMFTAELPSCHPHVAFDATFQFRWQGSDQALWHEQRRITEEAGRLTSRYSVMQAGNAETEINVRDTNGVHVRLTAGPQALAAAEAILEIERQAAIERMRQRAELERVHYLRESVYARPDVARSYWLYHHPDQLNAMLTIDFEGIAAKFGDVGDSRFLTIAKLLADFLGNLEDGDRRYLVGLLGNVFSSYDRADLVERLESS
jgi:hypothetical protein